MKLSTKLIKTLLITVGMVASGASLAAATGWNVGGGEQEEALHLTPNLENGM